MSLADRRVGSPMTVAFRITLRTPVREAFRKAFRKAFREAFREAFRKALRERGQLCEISFVERSLIVSNVSWISI